MKKIFNFIYYIFIACVLVVGLLLFSTVAPIPGNFKAKVVKSGSMEPTIMTGGLVIIAPRASYEVGDIITFGADTKSQIPTTHRIVSVHGEGLTQTFSTKGDANDAIDPTDTSIKDVGGKVIFKTPYLGYILDFAKKPLGFVLLVGVPTGLVIIDEIMKIFREARLLRRKKLLNAQEQQPKKQPNKWS